MSASHLFSIQQLLDIQFFIITMTDDEAEKNFRIHISGLSQDITNENDLTSKFLSFGTVTDSLIVKDTSSGISKGYGFVSLNCSEKHWLRCLSTLNGTKWKGSRLKLELARPSKLERITQERLETHDTEKPSRKYIGTFLADDQSLMTDDKIETRKGWKKVRYGRAVASLKLRAPNGRLFHYDPTLHQHQLKNFSKKEELIHKEIDSIPISSLSWFPDFSSASSSKRGQTGGSSINHRSISAVTKEVTNINKVSVIEQKAEQLKKSRALISSALSKLDKKGNNPNHITFSCDENSEQGSPIAANSLFKDDVAKARSLFDESSSDVSDNDAFNQKFLFGEDANSEGSETEIGIKKVFEGEKGQQRLNLQRRYGNDSRFKLGELFLDSDEEEGTEAEAPVDNDADAQMSLELAAEKDNALNLLQDVLGLPVESPQTTAYQNKKHSGVEWKEMMRYDPDAPNAEDLIIDKNSLVPVSQVKRPEIKPDSMPKDPELVQAPVPEVSADRHFTVSNKIGSIFTKDIEKRDKGSFSLFGNEVEESKNSENSDSESEVLAPASTTKITGVSQVENKSKEPKEPLFFFHFGNNQLYSSTRFSGEPVFCRTRTLQDLEADLNQNRSRLIRNYKSLHRSAKAKDDQPKKMFKRRKIMS